MEPTILALAKPMMNVRVCRCNYLWMVNSFFITSFGCRCCRWFGRNKGLPLGQTILLARVSKKKLLSMVQPVIEPVSKLKQARYKHSFKLGITASFGWNLNPCVKPAALQPANIYESLRPDCSKRIRGRLG